LIWVNVDVRFGSYNNDSSARFPLSLLKKATNSNECAKVVSDPAEASKRLVVRAFRSHLGAGMVRVSRLARCGRVGHSSGNEEYEEVLAFYPSNSRFRRWSMWRTHEHIVVQPTQGRTMHFTSVAGALESLIPVTDEAAGPDAT
jgi:hypothetical protein